MAHIGILCPAAQGHMNPMCCLGRELQSRGHRVTAFQVRDFEESVRKNGLDYWPLGEQEFPLGSTAEISAQLGMLHGLTALRYTVAWFIRRTRVLFDEGPAALRRAGVDLVLADQVEPGAPSVAERLQIPFVTVANALVVSRDANVPPVFTPWAYNRNWATRLRNSVAYVLQDSLVRSWLGVINEQRRHWRLPAYSGFMDAGSPLAQISQQPAAFEFPNRVVPECCHYTGPFHDVRVRPPVPFPFERLTGEPLIYASMGTLQNQMVPAFQEIARACEGLHAQLVISLGGGTTPERIGKLAGDPLVVSYAPQLELLKRATLTITHAGLNTVLESLSQGVPMVAIPVANDQPGVAARVKWTGTGEFLPLKRLRPGSLRPLVQRVLNEPRYRERARNLQTVIRKVNGMARAADIVEQVLKRAKPVLRPVAVGA